MGDPLVAAAQLRASVGSSKRDEIKELLAAVNCAFRALHLCGVPYTHTHSQDVGTHIHMIRLLSISALHRQPPGGHARPCGACHALG